MLAPYVWTKFQWFMSNPFKKLIVSTPRLLHDLITWVWQRLYQTVLRIASARKQPYVNALLFLMYPRKTVFKRWFLHSRTTISRLRKTKEWNYEFLSGIPAHAKIFSFMWDQLEKQLRKRGTSRPLKKIPRLMYNYVVRSSQGRLS